MPRKADDLFAGIASFRALHAAALRAVRGKRAKTGAASFMANLESGLLQLERELIAGTWRPGRYTTFTVSDPKPRFISAAPFRDRVVHHSLCAVVDPLFERGFIANSYANRRGKGSHRAIRCYERYRDRHAYVLRCDLWRYFPSIDHALLKAQFRRRVACERTLALLDAVVDGSNAQEPVARYFPGDDLFAPFERRRGLPIGNLTSQLFANLYLDPLDHYVTEVLQAPCVRYVDDFALFANDPATLERWRGAIEAFLVGRRLLLHPRKTHVAPTSGPSTFLGFELMARGQRALPEDNLRRFRRRLRGLRDRWRAGTVAEAEVRERVGSWVAHARHADSFRLRQTLFRGGWFDPSIDPSREPGWPASASASCAGARGTTIRRTCVPPTATGTTPGTATPTTVSVLPARP